MFFQNHGSVQNYYMYHGGTNFGRTCGGPYITTFYDYDAPLDEYGNLRQPKYGHLKALHALLIFMEKHLSSTDSTMKPISMTKSRQRNIPWMTVPLHGSSATTMMIKMLL